MTDTEIIATLVDQHLSHPGSDLCSAIKTVCETKLHGTWRLAVMAQDKVYLATNSGDFFVGRSEDCFVFCSSDSLHSLFPNFDKMKRNTLVEVSFSDLKMVEVAALKKKVHKMQTKQTEHIYLDEILQSVETVQCVTDFGYKFVADDQVCLGGFDKCQEELTLIQNLVIAANGPSRIAAQYGA